MGETPTVKSATLTEALGKVYDLSLFHDRRRPESVAPLDYRKESVQRRLREADLSAQEL